MPSDAHIELSPHAHAGMRRIASAHSIARLVRRIDALETFPRLGIADESAPSSTPDTECRVTYVAIYAIRYRYHPGRNEVVVDAITDERSDSPARFL